MPNMFSIENIDQYIHRRTLIVGDVNSGKTRQTIEILDMFLRAGYAKKMFILDFAPGIKGRIGKKLLPPSDTDLIYLTASIAAPRLTGKDEIHTMTLAKKNAKTIENLFVKYNQHPRDILFINDVTLYFHAGNFETISKLFYLPSTVVINAYYGQTFADSELTRREKKLTQNLMNLCHRVIPLPRR